MTDQAARNIAIMTEAFAALNRRDVDAVVAMMAPDFDINVAGSPHAKGIPAWRRNVDILFKAFPDAKVHVEDIFATDDKVAVRLRMKGTHQGPFLGQPATGKTIAYDSNELYLIRDGQIAAEWICSDTMTMMTQIGIFSETKLIGLWLAGYKVWIAAVLGFALGAAIFALL